MTGLSDPSLSLPSAISQPGLIQLDLKDRAPIANGSERVVYVHPDYPRLVFKIVIGKKQVAFPTTFEHLGRKLFPVRLKMRRSIKEIDSHIWAKLKNYRDDTVYPIAEMRGFFSSDLGPAVAFERIMGADGQLATTLYRIVETDGLTPDHITKLNDFVARLLAWNLIVSDLHLGNIVLGNRLGVEQFVLVDGVGAPHMIPLRYWSRRINRREVLLRLARVGREINTLRGTAHVTFDARTAQFHLM